jgi:hypothetical protein
VQANCLSDVSALLLLLPGTGAAAPKAVAHSSAFGELTGSNLITANRSSVTRVLLEKAIRMPVISSVRTRGRIAGVAVVKVEPRKPLEERPGFYGISFARCASLPCRDYGRLEFGYSRLPAGLYDVYLIADKGSRAEVELVVRGLSGETVLRPTSHVRSEVRSFSALSDNVSADGAETSLTGDGFGFFSFALDAERPHAATSFGHCVYRQGETLPPAPYQPARCPPIGLGDTVFTNLDGLRLTSYGFTPLLPKALGLWHTTAGPVENVSALGLWVATR